MFALELEKVKRQEKQSQRSINIYTHIYQFNIFSSLEISTSMSMRIIQKQKMNIKLNERCSIFV